MARRPLPAHRRIVTLSTDVGTAYAAQMKAVLARSIAPGRIVDLTHDLPPHDVRTAAFLLRAMASGFPPGTVHVAVVDPGVGGRRAPILLRCADGSFLVGPDNGVLSLLAERLGRPKAYRIDPDRLGGGSRVGTTFDGRDVFAPAAAQLARGTPPGRLGSPAAWERITLPAPVLRSAGAGGEVLFADRFGNLITNVPTAWIPPATVAVSVRLGRARARGRLPWAPSYEALGTGRLGALGSSFGSVELSVGRGSAARKLRAGSGTPVTITWARRPRRIPRGTARSKALRARTLRAASRTPG